MILGLLAVASAQQTCIQPVSLMQIGAELGEVRKSLEVKDVADVRARLDRVTERLPCVDDVLPANAWAEYARYVSIAFFFRQEEDEMVRWANASAWADPELPWGVAFPEEHPLRRMLADAASNPTAAPSERVLVPPKGGAIVISGHLAERPEAPEDVPVFVQVFDRDRVRVGAWLQSGPQFPEEWIGDGAPAPAPSWWGQPPAPAAARPARPARPAHGGGLGDVALVPVATGGGLLLASGVTYLLAAQAAGSLDARPTDELTGARTRANLLVLASGTALVGGVGLVGGGVLLSANGVTFRF